MPGAAKGIFEVGPTRKTQYPSFAAHPTAALPADHQPGIGENRIGQLVRVIGTVLENQTSPWPPLKIGRRTVQRQTMVQADSAEPRCNLHQLSFISPQMALLTLVEQSIFVVV